MYTLQQLAEVCDGQLLDQATASAYLSDVVCVADKAAPGSLFVAITGTSADGHNFIERAIQRGASACVVEREVAAYCPRILVKNSRIALSRLAAFFHSHPSKNMKVVGITGTNGKTTTQWLIFHMLNSLGLPSFRLGTLGLEIPGYLKVGGDLTTPDAVSIQKQFRAALQKGMKGAVMEVSSHALDQHRVDDIEFDVGVFTNLSRDHLDYHTDMERYFQAKRRLFWLMSQGSKSDRSAVINLDDAMGQRLVDEAKFLKLISLSFGRSVSADLKILGCDFNISGTSLQVFAEGREYTAQIPFIGSYNVQNFLAAVLVCRAVGYKYEQIFERSISIPQVPGRLEAIRANGFTVFVDYAHSPDALEKVLRALSCLTEKDLWVVFGCGGDRDKGKRPLMGKVAALHAKRVVVTSDNPRTEDPQAIIDDILGGGVNPELVEVDRRKAIRKTLERAGRGDIVLIAGKGHEDYQIIGKEKFYLSDSEEVKKFIGA